MTVPISEIWPSITVHKAKAVKEGLLRMGDDSIDNDSANMEQSAALALMDSIISDVEQLHKDIIRAEKERRR